MSHLFGGRFALIILLLALPATAKDSAYAVEEIRIRAVVLFYGVDEAFIRALRHVEMGPKDYEFGAKPSIFRAAYTNPCIPEGGGQYAAAGMGMIAAMQKFIFANEFNRRQFFKFFGTYWHGASTEAQNALYAKALYTRWLEERSALLERTKAGGYNPQNELQSNTRSKSGIVKP